MLISAKVGFTGTIRPKRAKGLKSLIDDLVNKRDIGTISDISDLGDKIAIEALVALRDKVAIRPIVLHN
ncbi:hypothetical protein C2G38_440839 [Gigaspora rosea]|uniref:Uncharacterized protein n=1 Tax=Gigaspora rosea TaxID=44941 RepID=A0A397UJG9_9GLOM|nr:hypothetical protein C2G38_440839 [Gigaspora rosea]